MSRRLRWPRFADTVAARVGLCLLAALVFIAIVGPVLAPYSPYQIVGPPGAPPGGGHLLGTDYIGEDVFSRLLCGGRTVFLLGGAATVTAYLVGVSIGLVAGYRRNWTDGALMRSVDVVLAFPQLLIILLMVAALGSGLTVMVGAVALVEVPGISRVVRTATLEVSTRGYVEAAVARGETTREILRREILPNVIGVVMADVGLRFTYAIILIASVNYLGLGIAPPHADWGLMIAESRTFITANIWSVLAPALCLGLLTVSVNLVGDAYARSRGRYIATVAAA